MPRYKWATSLLILVRFTLRVEFKVNGSVYVREIIACKEKLWSSSSSIKLLKQEEFTGDVELFVKEEYL